MPTLRQCKLHPKINMIFLLQNSPKSTMKEPTHCRDIILVLTMKILFIFIAKH